MAPELLGVDWFYLFTYQFALYIINDVPIFAIATSLFLQGHGGRVGEYALSAPSTWGAHNDSLIDALSIAICSFPQGMDGRVCKYAVSASSTWGACIETLVNAQHYLRGWGRTSPTSIGYARYNHYSILHGRPASTHGAPTTEGFGDGIPQPIFTSWGG